MATMVCRAGSQPCLESQLVEPRTPLWFKYSSPKPNFSQSPIELALKSGLRDLASKERSVNPHENETSEISVPSLIWLCPKEPILTEKAAEASYVHPLVKRSQSSLSERSLEMCTENLGNETGSDFIGSSFFSPAELKGGRNSQSREIVNSSPSRQLLRAGMLNNLHKFPPPLTTISGSKSLSVRPHRLDGRLILQVVETTERKNPRFLAERSNGSLRLYLLRSNTTTCTGTEAPEKSHRKQYREERNEEENEVGETGTGEAGEEDDRMGMEKLERVCNCMCREGENESDGFLLTNWEPLWISSS